jgi:uncharacterized protein YbbC (DUF1343 family)
MRAGLDVFFDDVSPFKGQKIGVCCNHTAVDTSLNHLLDRLIASGLKPTRVFTPEHGLHATAQDMIQVQDGEGAPTSCEVISLYGTTEASLHPRPEQLKDLDIVLFDIQDIGSRYYTYQATLGYLMEAAAQTRTKILVLDRPNPIDGVSLEGNVIGSACKSFVGAYPLAVRHGMTMGELGGFFRKIVGIKADIGVVRCEGWLRHQYFDETGLPWVYPSPNMPTLETAILYPGLCLIEGTNLSEGRGTTRPFHLVGAPYLKGRGFLELCRSGALDAGLEGVAFRAATFEPRFQKFAGQLCHGVELTVSNRHALNPLLCGLVVLEAALRAAPEHFRWRTETYEFVEDPPAIDLLTGSAEVRVGLPLKIRPREIWEQWEAGRKDWEEARESCLLY